MADRLTRGERVAVGALGLLLAVSVGWWALALWPVPADTPAWLLRTREVCFGRTDTGLPELSGWMLLVGEPLGMLGLLLAGWRHTLVSGLRKALRAPAGRGVAMVVVVGLVAGFAGVGVRVANATAEPLWASSEPDELPSETYPEIDRPAPENVLVDQHGDARGMRSFRGRPVLVTFAFGNCETICPVVAHRVVAAREALAGEDGWSAAELPAVVILTLDPWRDTPSRLGHLREQWMLPDDATVLGGEVAEVEAALDAWNVHRSRDVRTGDIIHPALVYLVDREGVIRYATTDGVDVIVELARRMRP